MSEPTPAAFISYSREDSEFALRLAEDLKAAGVSVWLDQLDIDPGFPWDIAIEQALTQAPRMLLILSPSSAKSSNVLNEISFALERQKIIIPILHRKCLLPLQIQRIQRVDFTTDYPRGITTLMKYLVTPPEIQAREDAERKRQEEAAREASDTESKAREEAESKAREEGQPRSHVEPPPGTGRKNMMIYAIVAGAVIVIVIFLAGYLVFSSATNQPQITQTNQTQNGQTPAPATSAATAPNEYQSNPSPNKYVNAQGPPLTASQNGPVRVPADVMGNYLISSPDPVFPPIAKAAHVQGAVVLQAIISKTGRVENLRVISGPEMLKSTAIQAVSQWRYKPYLIDKNPVEVETTVTLNFTFRGDEYGPKEPTPNKASKK